MTQKILANLSAPSVGDVSCEDMESVSIGVVESRQATSAANLLVCSHSISYSF